MEALHIAAKNLINTPYLENQLSSYHVVIAKIRKLLD